MSFDVMRFRGEIVIDFEAGDFRAAAEQEEAIRRLFEQAKASFATATLSIAQRRPSRRLDTPAASSTRVRRSLIAAYDE